MKVYVFIYNVVAIKANFLELPFENNSKFILIASNFCINKLTQENKQFFDAIHQIHRNFHTPDAHRIEAIISDLIDHYDSNNIVLLSNEDSTQIICATLRAKYQLNGNRINEVLPYVNKYVSKLKLNGQLKTPLFTLFDKEQYKKKLQYYTNKLIMEIGFPMFIKPIDLVSSIGTYEVRDANTLFQVLESISNSPWEFEIDEYIDGDLFHCDFIIVDNQVKFFAACHYANPLAQFSKGSPMGSIPVNDSKLFNELYEFSSEVLKLLGTFSSAFHVEVFKDNKTGLLIFLEAAARTPGALVPEMYEISHGVNLEQMHFLTKLSPDLIQTSKQPSTTAGWITYPKTEGIIQDICFPEITIKHKNITHIQKGDKLTQAKCLLDSACSVLFWDSSHERLNETFDRLKASSPVKTS